MNIIFLYIFGLDDLFSHLPSIDLMVVDNWGWYLIQNLNGFVGTILIGYICMSIYLYLYHLYLVYFSVMIKLSPSILYEFRNPILLYYLCFVLISLTYGLAATGSYPLRSVSPLLRSWFTLSGASLHSIIQKSVIMIFFYLFFYFNQINLWFFVSLSLPYILSLFLSLSLDLDLHMI